MKEITAFKSNSGDLYNTKEEAQTKDLMDDIIGFMNKDYSSVPYDQFSYYRTRVIQELSEKIIKEAEAFRKIFNRAP